LATDEVPGGWMKNPVAEPVDRDRAGPVVCSAVEADDEEQAATVDGEPAEVRHRLAAAISRVARCAQTAVAGASRSG
jgi:hypothetical protein